jgi:hypothetical protein
MKEIKEGREREKERRREGGKKEGRKACCTTLKYISKGV